MKDHGRGGQILTVSNRGPFEYRLSEQGEMEAVPGQGGLATALRVAAQIEPTTWLSSPISAEDRAIAEGTGAPPSQSCGSQFVVTDPAAYDLFYGRFSNEVLWFLQHGLDLPESIDRDAMLRAWTEGYVPVNEAFANAAIERIGRGRARAVMFHDYHFYLAPRLVRMARPECYLQHFVHIPWPESATWRQLDGRLVREICEGLLANDSVVFQTAASARNFLSTCADVFGEQSVDLKCDAVRQEGHVTRVWSNGISVDPAELAAAVASPEFSRYRWDLRESPGRKTIVRVDRLDVTKNVIRGFQAYEQLLEEHSELQERVSFLALLVPSRLDIEAYKANEQETHALVDRINRRFGNSRWKPVRLVYENNRLQALAAMSLYDVLLVNPLADGMNLVAKEGPMVNTHDGVLVLSRKAGAYDSLGDAALAIEPENVDATAAALYEALNIPEIERHNRANLLRARIRSHDLKSWFRLLLEDINRHRPAPAAQTRTLPAA